MLWELAKAHQQMLLEEAEHERISAEYRRVKKQAAVTSGLRRLLLFAGIRSARSLKRKDIQMKKQQPVEEQREMIIGSEALDAERQRLEQCGFIPEEIVALFWLRQWYQAGGSDRVDLLHHWEFLKLLVRQGKLES